MVAGICNHPSETDGSTWYQEQWNGKIHMVLFFRALFSSRPKKSTMLTYSENGAEVEHDRAATTLELFRKSILKQQNEFLHPIIG